MLDLRTILDNPENILRNNQQRQVDVDMEQLVAYAQERRTLIQSIERLQQQQNALSKKMKGPMSPEERAPLIEEGRTLREEVNQSNEQLQKTEQKLHQLHVQIPNLTHPDVPIGSGEEDNREIKQWGKPTSFDFVPKDHVELGESLKLLDWEQAAKVTGAKFYFLRNEAVWLELALQKYALTILEEEGFQIFTTPDLARKEILEGIGYQPRGEASQIYSIEGTDLSLIATAEITLGGFYRDQILSIEQLPQLCAGISHCFRRESGAPGRESRGLYRVHQFTKVEMFAFTAPEDSDAMLDRFLAIEERIFQGLQIPYRVVDCCTADLGGQAYRKYDIEAWMPGRGKYGEITSASNCTDYQARRLKIRTRKEGEKKTSFVHTLNGTAIAISRALLAILENHQNADGSVNIPKVLQAWVGKSTIVPKP